MQTEKEFKELAQAWADDDAEMRKISFILYEQSLESILELMWRSYNQGEQDKIQDANETWEQCKNERT